MKIVVEDRLKELFATLPPIIGDSGAEFKPVYDYGTQEDLLRLIRDLNKQQGVTKYPMIWLETPIKQTGDEIPIYVDLKLILATQSNATLSNRERLEETFKKTLFPLLDNVKKSLRLSGFSRIMNPDNNVETKYYNFTEIEQKIGKATDIWDVIKFECEVRFTDCPLRNINY